MEGNNTSFSLTKSDQHSNVWDCHICMQLPTDPVATPCGHIFCWPCIYQWLRNGPQPCPVCRTHLSKDRNILPLYNGGGARAGPTHGNGDGNSNGDGNNVDSDGDGHDNGEGSAVDTAASDRDVIPPRPRNALLFGAQATARLEGSESDHEADDSQLSLRDLVLEILHEKVALERRVIVLEQRNCDLRLEAHESAVRHLQGTINRVQQIGRLRRQIVRKDQMLCRANYLLPPGWSDGIL